MTTSTPSNPISVLTAPPNARKPRPPVAGAWRYNSGGRSRTVMVGAVLTSAALHALLLFGFNHKAPKVEKVVEEEEMTIALVMPDLKELDEPEPTPTDSDEPPMDIGLSVPTLADVPSTIDLSNAFVQQIDFSTLTPQQDLSAAKAITIPTNINRGGKVGGGMTNLFNIADLDRVPEPIVRVAPQVPVGMREAGFRGEVRVGFIVNANGDVVQPYIIRSTHQRLEDPALVAIAKWKFRPGIKGGRKVNTRMVQPLVFTVSERD
ncbi:MAG: energy transducer TonB [Opitutus sp.]|nr:energy transducer TonB [Opitutus sp.]